MGKLFNKISSIIGRGRLFKILFNLSPMYRRTGGRLIEVSDDLKYVKIKLRLNYKTKNYVGTIYGGHMYSCVDGIYMVQLINILGKNYVVWDKSATIRFRKPGNKTLFAAFKITDELLEQIKQEINQDQEKDFKLSVNLTDKEGSVYAEIEKVIYIASREYYQKKRKDQKQP
ncbi:MAG: hypothetical protein DHS20C18_08690 [Saprospiraceae bacterium]|nr:MAG: hypothetical protein DHS20C18_08690 [Saprospiraceae bacterium]